MKSLEGEEILVVDDSPASLKLIGRILSEAGYHPRLATDAGIALRSVRQRAPALILLDVRMPGMNGYELCQKLKAEELSRSIPVIFLSVSEDGEEKALAFQVGGVDYVSKPVRATELLARVGTHLSLRRAQLEVEARNRELELARESLEERVKARSAELVETNRRLAEQVAAQIELHGRLRESEARLAQIVDFLPDATFAIDLEGTVIVWNRAMEQMTGIKAVDAGGAVTTTGAEAGEAAGPVAAGGMLGKRNFEYAIPFHGSRRPLLIDLVLRPSEGVEALYEQFRRESDHLVAEGYARSEQLRGVYLLGTAAPLYNAQGALIGAIESLRDITDRKRAEDAIRTANQRFSSVLRAATAYSIVAMGPTGTIEVMNEGAELMLGYSAGDLLGVATPVLFHDPKELALRAREDGIDPGFEVLVHRARRGEVDTREWTYVRRDGSRLTVSMTVTAMRSDRGDFSGFICIARDVTGEKKLEQQLLQSQKMEAIGMLSGGIAHDFNNLLTPIKGYAELTLMELGPNDPLRPGIEEIGRAADNAKELTHQLLAFSRKQVIELRPVNLQEIVQRSSKILRRTIRESIAIAYELATPTATVRADASQIELVLVNLSINAQDAMPSGGTLTIETAEVTLDSRRAAQHPGLRPGPHVMLAVRDTGTGMDERTMARVFEPFFTTKEVGKGTGLGLSTVYGIVAQHGGSIAVSSEIGRGTRFEILLPRAVDGVTVPGEPPSDAVLRGSERILVLEDDAMVRALLSNVLPSLGYKTLIAASFDECIGVLKSEQGKVDLLLTDVVMPGMNGRDVYERLRELVPDLKVLFMSGYTTDVLGHHGALDPGLHLLRKPFTRSTLSLKIREALR